MSSEKRKSLSDEDTLYRAGKPKARKVAPEEEDEAARTFVTARRRQVQNLSAATAQETPLPTQNAVLFTTEIRKALDQQISHMIHGAGVFWKSSLLENAKVHDYTVDTRQGYARLVQLLSDTNPRALMRQGQAQSTQSWLLSFFNGHAWLDMFKNSWRWLTSGPQFLYVIMIVFSGLFGWLAWDSMYKVFRVLMAVYEKDYVEVMRLTSQEFAAYNKALDAARVLVATAQKKYDTFTAAAKLAKESGDKIAQASATYFANEAQGQLISVQEAQQEAQKQLSALEMAGEADWFGWSVLIGQFTGVITVAAAINYGASADAKRILTAAKEQVVTALYSDLVRQQQGAEQEFSQYKRERHMDEVVNIQKAMQTLAEESQKDQKLGLYATLLSVPRILKALRDQGWTEADVAGFMNWPIMRRLVPDEATRTELARSGINEAAARSLAAKTNAAHLTDAEKDEATRLSTDLLVPVFKYEATGGSLKSAVEPVEKDALRKHLSRIYGSSAAPTAFVGTSASFDQLSAEFMGHYNAENMNPAALQDYTKMPCTVMYPAKRSDKILILQKQVADSGRAGMFTVIDLDLEKAQMIEQERRGYEAFKDMLQWEGWRKATINDVQAYWLYRWMGPNCSNWARQTKSGQRLKGRFTPSFASDRCRKRFLLLKALMASDLLFLFAQVPRNVEQLESFRSSIKKDKQAPTAGDQLRSYGQRLAGAHKGVGSTTDFDQYVDAAGASACFSQADLVGRGIIMLDDCVPGRIVFVGKRKDGRFVWVATEADQFVNIIDHDSEEQWGADRRVIVYKVLEAAMKSGLEVIANNCWRMFHRAATVRNNYFFQGANPGALSDMPSIDKKEVGFNPLSDPCLSLKRSSYKALAKRIQIMCADCIDEKHLKYYALDQGRTEEKQSRMRAKTKQLKDTMEKWATGEDPTAAVDFSVDQLIESAALHWKENSELDAEFDEAVASLGLRWPNGISNHTKRELTTAISKVRAVLKAKKDLLFNDPEVLSEHYYANSGIWLTNPMNPKWIHPAILIAAFVPIEATLRGPRWTIYIGDIWLLNIIGNKLTELHVPNQIRRLVKVEEAVHMELNKYVPDYIIRDHRKDTPPNVVQYLANILYTRYWSNFQLKD